MECDATAWLVDFPNPYSHRHRGRNPFAQHLNYPKIDSSTNDYPKTTLTFVAFCRTVRKCVKALSENYPTKWCRFFMTIRNAKITIRKCFRPATLARDNIHPNMLGNVSKTTSRLTMWHVCAYFLSVQLFHQQS